MNIPERTIPGRSALTWDSVQCASRNRAGREAEADCVQGSSEMGSWGAPEAQGACGNTWLTAEVL